MAGKGKSSGSKARSAVTGRYVTKKYADKHPRTTVVETSKPGGSNPGKKGSAGSSKKK